MLARTACFALAALVIAVGAPTEARAQSTTASSVVARDALERARSTSPVAIDEALELELQADLRSSGEMSDWATAFYVVTIGLGVSGLGTLAGGLGGMMGTGMSISAAAASGHEGPLIAGVGLAMSLTALVTLFIAFAFEAAADNRREDVVRRRHEGSRGRIRPYRRHGVSLGPLEGGAVVQISGHF